jgi:urease accessory protein
MPHADSLTKVVRLLALSDTAFPVGAFSFSDGLESAVACGVVRDAPSLEEYAYTIACQVAHTDGVAALCSLRAAESGDFDELLRADSTLIMAKTSFEARLKAVRMGRRLAELAARILPTPLTQRWHDAVQGGLADGCYATSLGVLCSAAEVGELEMFAAVVFGALATVSGAALRLLRLSHFDTQSLMFRLSERTDALYADVCEMTLDEMYTFAPEADILMSIHERGFSRMFMN